MRKIAEEQDVEVPQLHREVLCTQVLQEAHSGLLAEVSVWLDPSKGMDRAEIETLVQQHLQLQETKRGEFSTMYCIPNDPSYATLTLEYDNSCKFQEYHYLRK